MLFICKAKKKSKNQKIKKIQKKKKKRELEKDFKKKNRREFSKFKKDFALWALGLLSNLFLENFSSKTKIFP